jgi:NADPH:quinone reductase-like Zn-dependent oxidoreductase
MKAIVQDRYGASEVLSLQDVERPVPGKGQVLLRVHAASLHIGDWHLMTGTPYLVRLGFGLRGPRARVRGMDVAGRVEAVGEGVTSFTPGDEVFGSGEGTLAEYACAKAEQLVLRPAGLTPEQAAAVPTSAATALQALKEQGGVQPGQRVLVIGASGGVGLYAVQLAKAFGAHVTGVCSTGKAELVRSLGADAVVDYTREDVTASGQRYDLVLDCGGNRPLSALRRVLAPKGTLVIVGGEEGGKWFGGMGRPLGALALGLFVGQKFKMLVSLVRQKDLQELSALLAAGKVRPVIDRTFPLAEGREAMHALEGGRARGKLVVTA